LTKKSDYASRRIMVVDDEPFMQNLIERILKQFNVGGIIKVRDGGEAIKMVKDNLSQVDCIIADFNMKPVNGLQLLQAVRVGVNPRIPRDQAFIMLTGSGKAEVVKTAVMLDVSGYLMKPVSSEKLTSCLDRALSLAIHIKEPEYYQAISLQNTSRLNDAAPSTPKAWVILSKASVYRDVPAIKEKISTFRTEHATRDGIEEVKLKNRRQSDLGELQEGMILAEDIEAEEGNILLRKGTRLTARMVDRLRELAVATKSRTFVWIGDLA